MLARIDERLQGHVAQSGVWQGEMTTRTVHIEECVAKDNVRIDRIEQREKGRSRLIWIAVTAASASLVGWIRSHWE